MLTPCLFSNFIFLYINLYVVVGLSLQDGSNLVQYIITLSNSIYTLDRARNKPKSIRNYTLFIFSRELYTSRFNLMNLGKVMSLILSK